MKVTNRAGLPDSIVRAVQADPYTKGEGVDYSCTELLKPPRSVAIAKAHWDELEEDVLDRVWSLFGSAVHVIIDRAAGGESMAITEERVYDVIYGFNISGRFDHWEDEVLDDFKVTSVWTRIYGSSDEDWEAQLNILAHLCRRSGYPVKRIFITAIYRDWNQRDLDKDTKGNYPKAPVERVEFKLWPKKKTLEFIKKRIELHEAAKHALLANMEPDECTEEERWWNARAKKSNRCARYCAAAPWCSQYQKELRESEGEEL